MVLLPLLETTIGPLRTRRKKDRRGKSLRKGFMLRILSFGLHFVKLDNHIVESGNKKQYCISILCATCLKMLDYINSKHLQHRH